MDGSLGICLFSPSLCYDFKSLDEPRWRRVCTKTPCSQVRVEFNPSKFFEFANALPWTCSVSDSSCEARLEIINSSWFSIWALGWSHIVRPAKQSPRGIFFGYGPGSQDQRTKLCTKHAVTFFIWISKRLQQFLDTNLAEVVKYSDSERVPEFKVLFGISPMLTKIEQLYLSLCRQVTWKFVHRCSCILKTADVCSIRGMLFRKRRPRYTTRSFQYSSINQTCQRLRKESPEHEFILAKKDVETWA